MAFNVNEFMSHFAGHGDFAKSSKFEVVIFPPSGLAGLSDSRGLTFQCESAEVPGYNINTLDGRTYGVIYPVASSPTFNDIVLTFICAGDMWEKFYFDSWMDQILPKSDYGYTSKYRDEYVSNIYIKTFQETAADQSQTTPQISSIVRVVEAFPSSTAPISLNWAGDDISRLAVTFKYIRWELVPESQYKFLTPGMQPAQQKPPLTKRSFGSLESLSKDLTANKAAIGAALGAPLGPAGLAIGALTGALADSNLARDAKRGLTAAARGAAGAAGNVVRDVKAAAKQVLSPTGPARVDIKLPTKTAVQNAVRNNLFRRTGI